MALLLDSFPMQHSNNASNNEYNDYQRHIQNTTASSPLMAFSSEYSLSPFQPPKGPFVYPTQQPIPGAVPVMAPQYYQHLDQINNRLPQHPPPPPHQSPAIPPPPQSPGHYSPSNQTSTQLSPQQPNQMQPLPQGVYHSYTYNGHMPQPPVPGAIPIYNNAPTMMQPLSGVIPPQAMPAFSDMPLAPYYVALQQTYFYQPPQHTGYMPKTPLPPAYRLRKKSKYSTIWTSKEDELLRELKEVQKLGWREMSTFFEERTPNACQFRWRRLASGISRTLPTKNSHGIDKHALHALPLLLATLIQTRESELAAQFQIKEEEEEIPPVSPVNFNISESSLLSPTSPTSAVSMSPKSKPSHSINFLLN